MKKFISLMLAVALLILTGCSDSTNDPEPSAREISIGALIPLSGSFGQQGTTILEALELAVEDANSSLSSQGINTKIVLKYDDTQTEPDMAVELLESYLNQGIRIIVGPLTSMELLSCKDLINSSDAVIISPSSTSLELSAADDNIFRIVPDDSEMAEAIAELARLKGINYLSMIHRDDVWGNGLTASIKSRFESKGGTVLKTSSYWSFRQSLYAEAMDSISTVLKDVMEVNDSSTIGLQISCFDEGADILAMALTDSVLNKITWFGSDGIATNSYLLTDTNAVSCARKTNFCAPVYGIEETTEYLNFKSRLGSSTAGIYAYLSYDAMRVAAEIIANSEETESISGLKIRVFNTLNGYEGVCGTVELNSNGDRAKGLFNFWSLNDAGTPAWEVAYTYKDGTIEEK